MHLTMTQEHPITPPPELVDQWRAMPEYIDISEKLFLISITTNKLQDIATQAARWGADQELKACCEWLKGTAHIGIDFELINARRPKPQSLKEQAYDALDTYIYGEPNPKDKEHTYNIICRALEALPDEQ
jgi:hypothetical protein